jgi:hypothetical protein
VQEVAEASDAVEARDDAPERRPARAAGERAQVAGRERRLLESLDAAHRERRAVQVGAGAALGPGHLAPGRRRRHAELESPAPHHRDLGREHRVAAHEALGPVDGVDEPDVLRVGARGFRLLAAEAVVREASRDQRADRLFRGDVRVRDRRPVGLRARVCGALVGRANDLGRAGRGGERRFEPR